MKFFAKLMKIDRRIIFILIFIGVAIPLIVVLGFKLETTKEVENIYNMVENTPENTKILISFDYDPATKPEIQPMAVALLHHAFRKKLRVICVALWPMGVILCNEAIETVKKDFPDLEYGVNYVNLGYKSGGLVTINHMGKNFRETFPTDAGNVPIDELAIMDGIKDFKKLGFIIGLSAGDPGLKQWVQVAHDTYGKELAGGSTAVQVPSLSPYVNQQRQLLGLLGGLKGAAEYEALINTPSTATKGMDAQSVAHIIIILFIIVGNIGFFVTGKHKEKLK